MIDIQSEKLMTLTEAREWLGERMGRKLGVATLSAWIKRGVERGAVKLDAVKIGGRWFTTADALQRFCDRLSAPDRPVVLTTKRRQAEIDAAQRKALEIVGLSHHKGA